MYCYSGILSKLITAIQFFQSSGILTVTTLLGVTSIKTLRSCGSSVLCPSAQKVKKSFSLNSRKTHVCVCFSATSLNTFLLCVSDKYQECVRSSGQAYRGTKSVTKSGSQCLPWDSPILKRKLYNAWRSDALELGLGSHKSCR